MKLKCLYKACDLSSEVGNLSQNYNIKNGVGQLYLAWEIPKKKKKIKFQRTQDGSIQTDICREIQSQGQQNMEIYTAVHFVMGPSESALRHLERREVLFKGHVNVCTVLSHI
jgi:hypothetical protein